MFDGISGVTYMKNDERYLDELDKNVKNQTELSNFYMTQPLTPLDQKLSADMMTTYCVIPEHKTKLSNLFSPNV